MGKGKVTLSLDSIASVWCVFKDTGKPLRFPSRRMT
jgi:hypothetical protein